MALHYAPKTALVGSPISSFVVFDTELTGQCQQQYGYRLPYQQGDVLGFQVSYNDATLSTLGLSPSDLRIRITSTPAAMFAPVAIDTIRKVLLFAITMQFAWGCTEMEVVAPTETNSNLFTQGNNGTFQPPIPSGTAAIPGFTATQGYYEVEPGSFGDQYLLISTDQAASPTTDQAVTSTSVILKGGLTYRIQFDYLIPVATGVTAGSFSLPDLGTSYFLLPSAVIVYTQFDETITVPGAGDVTLDMIWDAGASAGNPSEMRLDNIRVTRVFTGSLGTSNGMEPYDATCQTQVLKYRNQTDAFGASYQQDVTFYQRVRLPITIFDLQNESEDNVYTLPNQQEVITSSRMSRTFDSRVGPIPDRLVEAFLAARGHTDTQLDDQPVRISEASAESLPRTSQDYPLRLITAKVRDNAFVAQSLLG